MSRRQRTLSTNFPRLFAIESRARTSIGGATPPRRTAKPACANACAMPLPIVPAPTTPTVLIVIVRLSRRHENHDAS
jgi:hypothetical protein